MTEPESPAGTPLDSAMLRALAHPVRRRILSLMDPDSPVRATDLAADLHLPVNQVSFHLRSLARAGLVTEAPDQGGDRRNRRWVPTQDEYRIGRPVEPLSKEDQRVVSAFFGETAREQAELVRRVLAWSVAYAAGRETERRGAATQLTVRLREDELRDLVNRMVELVADAERASAESDEPGRRLWDVVVLAGRDDLRHR
jgi:DNA-binding transcriptional ArsR family regulator